MPFRLNASDADFEARFNEFLALDRMGEVDVDQVVRDILARVKAEGDAAVLAYTEKFDRLSLAPEEMRVTPEEVEAAVQACELDDLGGLRVAAKRIAAYHERLMPGAETWTDEQGVTLGYRWTAVKAAGLYVPGGKASYPSSVLMNAVAARVAGVDRLVMAVPAPDGHLNPLVVAAARMAGVDEIYRIGGAQAIAALAYGTETIAPVDVIVGPGNAYVATAKRMVYGLVGIDSVAGPSEIVVVSDGGMDPAWVAADLLSQAEHDEAAQSVLITPDAAHAEAVVGEIDRQLAELPRRKVAEESWRQNGAVILVPDLDAAVPIVDRLAPEHLELAVAAPEALSAKVRNAGAIFLGHFAPEAVGDYVAGPNHVLPTNGNARFSSGLSVLDFMKRTSTIGLTKDALEKIGPAAIQLAEAEGLRAHARSVAVRGRPQEGEEGENGEGG